MGRSDQARPPRPPIEHRSGWRNADARVQEQQRPSAAALDGLDADAVDYPRFRGGFCGLAVCGH
jgi:hypothetical protein